MASQDPLLLLRQSLSTSQEIHLLDSSGQQVFTIPEAASLSFPSTGASFPKATSTRFLRPDAPSSSEDEGAGYTLESLLFAFLHKDDSIGQYMRAATESSTVPVTSTDRRVVLEYLSGKGGVEGPEGRLRPLAAGQESAGSPSKRAAGGEGGENEPTPAGAASGAAGKNGAGGAAAPPPQKKQRYAPNREDLDKVRRIMQLVEGPAYGHVVGPGEEKKERVGAVYHSRETVLRGERPNNFDSVRSLIAPRLKLLRDEQNSKASAPSATAPGAPGAKPQKKKQLNPIIIISPSSTALITMHNVKQLLEEGRFIPSDLARAQSASAGISNSEDVLQISHARATTSGGTTAETRKARYFVVDGVEALAKFGGQGRLEEAWDRVVCVMTTGQEWQFKPYRWKEPRELFHHVKGIYPQWTTDAPNPKVKGWNVSELR
ncbi:hypothetical protein JCM10213_003790, partial [Rhodosporidiobolus nylandii]